MCSGSCLSPFKLALVFSSVQFSHSVMSDSLQPHEPQHARPPCPSPTARVYPYPCPLSRWCHPTISSSVVPFSSCPQSFPASGSFQMSQLFASGGQSTGVSASTSVLPMNIQDRSPLGWTGWISLETLKSLLQHHSSKASILWCSAFFIVQLSWFHFISQNLNYYVNREGRWEGVSKGRGYMYTYDWFMLRFDRKQQNSVKQLSFNKK